MPLSDWDIVRMALSDAQYVSAPKSLSKSDVSGGGLAICRLASTLNLPQGRIVAWVRGPYQQAGSIWFRHQNPLGEWPQQNYYYVSIGADGEADLGKVVAGAGTLIGEWVIDWPYDEWFHLRLTWWILPPCNAAKRMAAKLEVDKGEGWVDYGDFIDEDANFENTGIARVGLNLVSTSCWNDDFEIWGPC